MRFTAIVTNIDQMGIGMVGCEGEIRIIAVKHKGQFSRERLMIVADHH